MGDLKMIYTSEGLIDDITIVDNIPIELYTADGKTISIKYNSETKQLVIKAGANTLKSRLVN
jgi:hypothetical protein